MERLAQLEAVASWNGARGAELFRQHHFIKNNALQTAVLADAARHFVNHDRIRRQMFLLSHKGRR